MTTWEIVAGRETTPAGRWDLTIVYDLITVEHGVVHVNDVNPLTEEMVRFHKANPQFSKVVIFVQQQEEP